MKAIEEHHAAQEKEAMEKVEDNVELNPAEATKFRSVAALANYLALDRPDLQVAVSILCQKMAKPTAHDFQRLKRIQ